ncbi:universal stress protein [Salegentibacter mishustinae]|jgi:nucleotide-binding universal stress UspA family protein|uniref:Universal stress protein n=1 Tax=Salegentibacter mishustinae TaxID=270918 RepID=A0A0Q9Z9X6_9FLAO|nr:universal stress protein [Salegentibacter mishustinae]KRG29805.1 universal stress protein [Salegentibacter mishustinae]PNW21250.1 universal stress protein [Salegentibacter mishustinae]PZX60755.1 nucleotide-binding universal stress UspA family protein [Salegentibacter mishustinae]GGX00128.1 universal stress protein [Salegentibacter mishustinae]
MKNILVPTNFSKSSQQAAQLGIKLAQTFKAEIHFLHMIQTPMDWVDLDKTKEKRYPEVLGRIGEAKTELRELERTAEKKGLKCRTFIDYNPGQKNILHHSGHFEHDFIVTGSSGKKGFLGELMGSYTDQIVRNADVPVIVAKETEANFPWQNILFVSDFQEDVSRAFKEVIPLVQKLDAKLNLLRINTETDFNSINDGRAPIKDFLKGFPELEQAKTHVYNGPSVTEGVSHFTKHNPVDIIVMSTHGKTGFLSLFSKSVAEGVVQKFDLPVMTIKV